ncbi:hypothetical protein [Ascidiimonas sp. W6]|uniref:hypothetical protein n=1 Tax=Ascidiimonas meishanensis TaxID=3128903 RepID=UPI0030EDDD7A
MNTIRRFLASLVQMPQEILAAIIRILLLILLLLLYILYWLFKRRKRRKKPHEKKPEVCHKIPPHVTRKPNPCIYSQFYRMNQGLSVTWNNPDIEIYETNGTLADSSNLNANTDYLLRAKISNSAFDPSLATAVRCYYRPWSFNSPDKIPIELNPNGTEKMVFLDIAPWSSAIAEFKWHTPNVNSAHYCIQVECFHQDDINPNNNLGQENTNVFSAAPGETVETTAFLMNVEDRERTFQLMADAYKIDGKGVRLRLETKKIPLGRKPIFQNLRNYLLTVDEKKRSIKTRDNYMPKYTHYQYKGWDEFKENHRRGNAPLPDEWKLAINGLNTATNTQTMFLQGKEGKDVELQVKVPINAVPGDQMPINVIAIAPSGKIAGGVTLLINVK